MVVSEESLNKLLLCFKSAPKLLTKAQAKMAAERIQKCYSLPKGLSFPDLLEELEYSWTDESSSSAANAKGNKGNKRGKKKGRK